MARSAIKQLIKSPLAYLCSQGIKPTKFQQTELGELIEQNEAITRQLIEFKHQRGRLSGQFKLVEKGSCEHQKLLSKMRELGQQSAPLELQRKTIEKCLESWLEQFQTPSEPSSPTWFDAPQQHYQIHQFDVELLEHEQVERSGWFDFAAKQGCAYHQLAVDSAIVQSFGLQRLVLLARDEQQQIIGGLPLYLLSSKLFGRFAVSIPYFNYGGPVSRCITVQRALLQQAARLLQTHRLDFIEVRTIAPGLNAVVSEKKVSMVLELPNSFEQLTVQLGAKLRAQVNKALVHRPQLEIGGIELLDDFYRVFAENMRDLGTPVYAKSWFANLLRVLQQRARLVVVYHQQKPVAVAFLLHHNEVMEVPWASTLRRANPMNMNMWMYQQLLQYSLQQGCRFFDFGRSTKDAPTYRFKKQWGARAYQHYWYTLLPEGAAAAELNPDNTKFKLVIRIWQMLPVWLTKLVGPLIIKNLP